MLRVATTVGRMGCVQWVARALAGMSLLAVSGCVAVGALSRGKTAEKRGEYYEAYAIYAAAARQSPANRSVARAMARVAPHAAQHWKRTAHAFEAQDAFDQAWRYYMRALLIDPADAAALTAIEQIGLQHPETAEAARMAWLRGGERSLQVGRVSILIQEEAAGSSDSPAELESDASLSATPEQAGPAESSSYVGSVAETTVSRKDRRRPRRAALCDGLSVEVSDADRFRGADLSIYRGDRRVLRARHLKPGEEASVAGRSGSQYRLRVLSIEHATETVRVRLFPIAAPPPQNGEHTGAARVTPVVRPAAEAAPGGMNRGGPTGHAGFAAAAPSGLDHGPAAWLAAAAPTPLR